MFQIINTFGVEIRIFWMNVINNMAADALATCVTRSFVDILLTVDNKQFLVFHEEGFQQPAPSHYCENIYILCFLKFSTPRVNRLGIN